MIVACPSCYQVLCLLLSFTASSWTSRLWITWPFGYAGRGYADHFERPWDHHCWRCINRMHVFFCWIKFVVIEYLGNIPLRDVFQIIAMSHSFGWQIKWSMSSIRFLFLPVYYSLIASTLMSNHFLFTWAGVSAAGDTTVTTWLIAAHASFFSTVVTPEETLLKSVPSPTSTLEMAWISSAVKLLLP